MKICTKCKKEKELTDFEKQSKNSYRKICKKCRNKICYEQKKKNGAYERKKIKQKERRQDPKYRAYYVIKDAKNADKQQRGLSNDLTVEYINTLIKKGCYYCQISFENNKIKIGIDRIDNTLPHNSDDIVSCCTRCNFIRRAMPYDAWMLLVPSIRQAVNEGLLDNWIWGFKYHQ